MTASQGLKIRVAHHLSELLIPVPHHHLGQHAVALVPAYQLCYRGGVIQQQPGVVLPGGEHQPSLPVKAGGDAVVVAHKVVQDGPLAAAHRHRELAHRGHVGLTGHRDAVGAYMVPENIGLF